MKDIAGWTTQEKNILNRIRDKGGCPCQVRVSHMVRAYKPVTVWEDAMIYEIENGNVAVQHRGERRWYARHQDNWRVEL